jgi:hypothetical protein
MPHSSIIFLLLKLCVYHISFSLPDMQSFLLVVLIIRIHVSFSFSLSDDFFHECILYSGIFRALKYS